MESLFKDKKILFGLTGSIAIYKTVDWLRALAKAGSRLEVIMTESATRFVSPMLVGAIAKTKVHTDMFSADDAADILHINLGREKDLIIVAPATAQTLAKMAGGMADNLLTSAVLASRSPIVVCPAMNCFMYTHAATQGNINKIREYGYHVIEPGCGEMACGDEGQGRLPEWQQVMDVLAGRLNKQDLLGKRFLITAGPTEEPLDPVRFISNRSTGKMGYALARAAQHRGAEVILVSGPTGLEPPQGVEVVRIRTAAEMYGTVMEHAPDADCIVKVAAVSDYRPKTYSDQKIKKSSSRFSLDLEKNNDILADLGALKKSGQLKATLVGFAAESENLEAYALNKLREKHLDLIAVNDISGSQTGFAADTNQVILLDRDGTRVDCPLLSKYETAVTILDRVQNLQQR